VILLLVHTGRYERAPTSAVCMYPRLHIGSGSHISVLSPRVLHRYAAQVWKDSVNVGTGLAAMWAARRLIKRPRLLEVLDLDSDSPARSLFSINIDLCAWQCLRIIRTVDSFLGKSVLNLAFICFGFPL
jgi:hypothetical protein